tara:strand:- start:4978 stop:5148 length:171 start_codon:yes stop_codon:yes gene_type:complete
MNKKNADIVDSLLSDLYQEKRTFSTKLTVGKYEVSAKKIINSHLDKIENETSIPEA